MWGGKVKHVRGARENSLGHLREAGERERGRGRGRGKGRGRGRGRGSGGRIGNRLELVGHWELEREQENEGLGKGNGTDQTLLW